MTKKVYEWMSKKGYDRRFTKDEKLIKVYEWMSKKGYDRRFTKDVAPVIIDFIADDILGGFADVIQSFEPSEKEITQAVYKHYEAKHGNKFSLPTKQSIVLDTIDDFKDVLNILKAKY